MSENNIAAARLSESCKHPLPSARDSFASTSAYRAARLGALSLLGSSGPILVTVTDRLLVNPRLNVTLPQTEYAALIWATGVALMIGNTLGNGIAMLMLRQLPTLDSLQRRAFVRTTVVLSAGCAAITLLLAAIACAGAAPPDVRDHAPSLLIPLLAMGMTRAVLAAFLMVLRVDRMFLALFGIHFLEALILLACLVTVMATSLLNISLVYCTSSLMALVFAMGCTQEQWRTGSWWDWGAARHLGAGVLPACSITLCEQSQVHTPRIAVGSLLPIVEVSVLFVASSVANMFVVPLNIVGMAVLSLLAGHSGFALRGVRAPLYLCVAIVVAVITAIATDVLGRLIIESLYPDKAADIARFFHWIAVATGGTVVMVFIRPVAIRYGSLERVAATSAASAIGQIVVLVLAVPVWGLTGAAVAIALCAVLGALWWVFIFVTLVLHKMADRPK